MSPAGFCKVSHSHSTFKFGIPLIVFMIIGIPSFARERFQVILGAGSSFFRYEPIGGLRAPRENSFITSLSIEYAPLPEPIHESLWLGVGSALINHSDSSYTNRSHQAYDVYMKISVPLKILNWLYGSLGLSWVQIRTIVPELDVSTAASSWLVRYSAGIQVPLRQLFLRLEFQSLQGRIPVSSTKFRYRRSGALLCLGLRI